MLDLCGAACRACTIHELLRVQYQQSTYGRICRRVQGDHVMHAL